MASDTTRAGFAGGTPAPQSILATVASTAAMAIAGNSDGGTDFEFVAAGFAHVSFGLSTVPDAALTDTLITSTPRRMFIDPSKVTHVKAIRNGAADVVVSFQRVR